MKEVFNNIPTLNKLRLEITKMNSYPKISETEINSYANFLFLIKINPSLFAIPTKNIDKVLHFHIKNKQLFKQDCINYFGYSLKHRECKSEKDLSEFKSNYELTNKLWYEKFNCLMGDNYERAFCGLLGDDGTSADTNDDDDNDED